MTSTELATLSPGRSAALKAWETRRARGFVPQPRQQKVTRPEVSAALAEFERQSGAGMPDWHAAALALKRALIDSLAGSATSLRQRSPQVITDRPKALPPPVWPDYAVDRASWRIMQWPSPMLVVTFADGEVVRAPAVSLQRKPVNVGRGLRIAIAFYQSRICRRLGLPNRPGTRPALPPIVSCVCEDTAEVYDAALCNARTVDDRAAQDWKMR